MQMERITTANSAVLGLLIGSSRTRASITRKDRDAWSCPRSVVGDFLQKTKQAPINVQSVALSSLWPLMDVQELQPSQSVQQTNGQEMFF